MTDVVEDDRELKGHTPENADGLARRIEFLQGRGKRLLPAAEKPAEVARQFLRERYSSFGLGHPTLLRWRGDFYRWEANSKWQLLSDDELEAEVATYVEHAVVRAPNKEGELVQTEWGPKPSRIRSVVQSVEHFTHLEDVFEQPSWIVREAIDTVFVACGNGLLDVRARSLVGHTPLYFNLTAVPFDYDPEAAAPRWLNFLGQLWPDDIDSVKALQEWFGYVVSGRLDLQKILLLTGPPRAGKGVITQVLEAVVGPADVASPTLASLGQNFGLQQLIGKPLAIVQDARLSPRGQEQTVERLLSISGQDSLSVDRKYKDHWHGRLPARLMMVSNELPQFSDASGAIVSRLLPLALSETWLGREDLGLADKLRGELPGVLNWALEGLDRLDERGKFTEPESAVEQRNQLQELASPALAFVAECCIREEDGWTSHDDLWSAWELWAMRNGQRLGTKQTLGKSLRAAVPGLVEVRRGPRDGARKRGLQGLSLRTKPRP